METTIETTTTNTAVAVVEQKNTVVMQVAKSRGFLVGTSGWLREYLSKCSLKIGQTKRGDMAVFLNYTDGKDSENQLVFVCGITTRRAYEKVIEDEHHCYRAYYYERQDFPQRTELIIYKVCVDESDVQSDNFALFGILTDAARKIAKELIDNCVDILIKEYQSDKVADYTIKVVPQEQ